ncbi:NAD(P)-dependent dehydrogenase, short-chain alcohol dehydrogenase family [Actinopolymorpha cephalotaxi]|uniref:NAD(P)-dependent dehydrogenase (Short-subunit alcohol dehydrogenase family) n=1 Tax=Actinopolymorpha cephalotaxi TaxID=504797 RepID=A0A1I2LTD6_9ACTN|nr:SDR family NAD(P)-dependent oxidoreductase [Actinopolymorpha cephalotaxi]NYH81370.1 NAD(P)-dependent dehydrogenase (short-subunit alcohol dehydrogenase family) [Actinopolymorpha cephalotaxi]SFF80717.1 NAD(P)-dependent dehydrogenase, short-chain alcohol dehydrogenase family [Actinopolymorpha cephalotaxi]
MSFHSNAPTQTDSAQTERLAPLTGKVALVTGGSRGIGAAVATRLAADGGDVVLTYQHRSDRAAEVVAAVKAAGRRALAVQADSADAAAVRTAVEAAVAEFGRLDILVNNAGLGVLAPLEQLSIDDIDRSLAVNVRAPLVAAQAAVPHMVDGGRIITIGSCVAERVAFPGFTAYATSKSALLGLTKALARELGGRGITATLVHPGPTDTDMNPADGPGAEAQSALTSLGRYGHAADVAATVAHLAGEGGRYMTGTAVAVDGGFAG